MIIVLCLQEQQPNQQMWLGVLWKVICLDQSRFCNFSHPGEGQIEYAEFAEMAEYAEFLNYPNIT